MSELAKKPRKLRVERMQQLPSAGGEDGHSWAVSYADFLMVLLSFFVVFFSQDDQNRGILIDIISASQGKPSSGAKATAGENSQSAKESSGTRNPAEKISDGTYQSMKSIVDGIPGFEIFKDSEKQLLVMNFPENIYPPGKYELKGEFSEVLNKILLQLQPQINGYEIRFVGHTDSTALQRRRGKTLETNFDLSSLRASRALERAVKLGLPASQLSTRGKAEFSRNSRTLSIVVVQQVGGH